jgi:glycosyltransferase involved in cell wall biosynthesis
LKEVIRFVESSHPDVVLVHFVPQLYGWNGAKPFFAALLLDLKRRGYPIVTIAHEFSAPFGPSLRPMFWASVHQLLLRLVLRASQRVILTTPFCLDLFKRRFPRRAADFRQVPVGCPVPVIPVDEIARQERRQRLGIAPEELVIATFGAVVDSVVPALEKVLGGFLQAGGPVRFLVIGKAGERVRRALGPNPAIGERLMVTGPVSTERVSEYVSLSDVYVALFPDGASTRRTTLMVGLAHGIPTISNVGALTDGALRLSGALHMLNGAPQPGPLGALPEMSRDPEWRRRLGRQGRAYFDEHFSWDRIRQQCATVLREVVAK